jgi:hypothetical protein
LQHDVDRGQRLLRGQSVARAWLQVLMLAGNVFSLQRLVCVRARRFVDAPNDVLRSKSVLHHDQWQMCLRLNLQV